MKAEKDAWRWAASSVNAFAIVTLSSYYVSLCEHSYLTLI